MVPGSACGWARPPTGGPVRSAEALLVGFPLMFVSDLRHFLGITDDAPGPARKMAEHLGSVVRAATAGEADTPWVTALVCRRRPGHKPCVGRIAVYRPDGPGRIEWKCTACGD